MIYFIQAGPGGPIKIGYTRDVGRRLETLQTGASEKLLILGEMEGTPEDEAAVHEMFDYCRRRAEWFNPDPSLMTYIEERMRTDITDPDSGQILSGTPNDPVGGRIEQNLIRLGFGQTTLKCALLAQMVEETGKKMTRGRVAAIMNSVNVSDKVVAALAKAVGVKPGELTTPKRKEDK